MARHERERDQAVAAEDYERANALKGKIDGLREGLDESRSGGRERAAEVLADDIAAVVSRRTGIPVAHLTREERERLLGLEAQIHERVVGQDEAVGAVAETLFGDEDAMVRFDISEFQERRTVSRLVGAPPGYVG
jgi:ATP-dependent Clp protease ATP-binding subunit ClpC